MNGSQVQNLRSRTKKDSRLPLYRQLADGLQKLIEEEDIAPGDGLPGDLEMAELVGVSSITVRKAYKELVKEGLIERTQRAGTFVRQDIHRPHPTIGFFYFIEAKEQMLRRAEYLNGYFARHRPRPYDLKIIGFGKDYYEKTNLVREVRQKDLQGAIVVALPGEGCAKQLKALRRSGFPFIRIGNQYADESEVPLVCGNERQNVRTAFQYVWEKGHRHIGLLARHSGDIAEQEFRKLYEERGGLRGRYILNLNFTWGPEEWRQLPSTQIARGYLEQNPELTAILVEGGLPCVDILHEAGRMGRNVPNALSLFSLTDREFLQIMHPPVTATKLSDREMAEEAARLLLEMIEHSADFGPEVHEVDYRLVERGSVAPVGENATAL